MCAPCGEILHDPYPNHLPGRIGKHNSFDVVLARVVVLLEDGKGPVTGP